MTVRHHLTIENRGKPHIHVWKPSCCCGWAGVPRRRRKEAVEQYRQHTAAVTHTTAAVPRPLTPVDQLPEGLR